MVWEKMMAGTGDEQLEVLFRWFDGEPRSAQRDIEADLDLYLSYQVGPARRRRRRIVGALLSIGQRPQHYS